MLKRSFAIAGKDLSLSIGGGQGLTQAILLGLLLIFVFSLSRPAGQLIEPQAASAIFWLASSFGLVLVFNTLFSIEESNEARLGLLSSPVPPHSIWLGKGIAGFGLLLCSQLVFLPATVVFLGQDIKGSFSIFVLALFAADWGLVSLGALLGAISQGQAARESLLSVILFPLLLPILLGAITIMTSVFSGDVSMDQSSWIGVILASDALFSGAGIILFPFVYSGEQ
ncbi:heme exporter protein CcmB [Maridesulfovibrio bastinii]|uniref:heme exporter protein CcmB n=1 Tax=Maridesulfovibrio bastinii TaxID=47157 RepID=UPI000422AA9C|nr:heme exporter protein CcmB [Maridesulfovibrio bastinii]